MRQEDVEWIDAEVAGTCRTPSISHSFSIPVLFSLSLFSPFFSLRLRLARESSMGLTFSLFHVIGLANKSAVTAYQNMATTVEWKTPVSCTSLPLHQHPSSTTSPTISSSFQADTTKASVKSFTLVSSPPLSAPTSLSLACWQDEELDAMVS
jgi:hypothetical protein